MQDNRIDQLLYPFFFAKEKRSILGRLFSAREMHAIRRFLSRSADTELEFFAVEVIDATLSAIAETTNKTKDSGYSAINNLMQEYIQKMIGFEQGFIHMDHNYRSHLSHTVYVYLLGIYLYEVSSGNYNELNMRVYDNICAKPQQWLAAGMYADEKLEFRRRWAYTAFLHDLHYPSESSLSFFKKEGKLNSSTKSPYFMDIRDVTDFFQFHTMAKIRKYFNEVLFFDKFMDSDILRIISARLAFRLECYDKESIYESLMSTFRTKIRADYWDHGLMGAVYSLKRYLQKLEEVIDKVEKEDKKTKLLHGSLLMNEYLDITDALCACALHNIQHIDNGLFQTKPKISKKKLPLLFTLILADELQLWNRSLCKHRRKQEFNLSPNNERIKLMRRMTELWDGMIFWFYSSTDMKDKQASNVVDIRIPFFIRDSKSTNFENIHKWCEGSVNGNRTEYSLIEPYEWSKRKDTKQICRKRVKLRFISAFSPDDLEGAEKPIGKGFIKDFWNKEYLPDHPSVCTIITYFQELENACYKVCTKKPDDKLFANSWNELCVVLDKNPIHSVKKMRQGFLPLSCFNYHLLKEVETKLKKNEIQKQFAFGYHWESLKKASDKIDNYLIDKELGVLSDPKEQNTTLYGYEKLLSILKIIHNIRQ